MKSKKIIIISILVVLVIGLAIALVVLIGKKNSSETKDVAVDNTITTKKDDEKNTSKDNTNTEKNTSKNESDTNSTNTTKKDKTKDTKSDDGAEDLSALEKQVFNSKFDKYAGEQTGSNMVSLLNVLKSNMKTEKDNEEKLPYITYINSEGEYIEETTDVNAIEEFITDFEKSHVYTIIVAQNDDTEFIHGIVISYDMNDDIKEPIEELAKSIANKEADNTENEEENDETEEETDEESDNEIEENE